MGRKTKTRENLIALILFKYKILKIKTRDHVILKASYHSLSLTNPANQVALTGPPLWTAACRTWSQSKAGPKSDHGIFLVLWDSSLNQHLGKCSKFPMFTIIFLKMHPVETCVRSKRRMSQKECYDFVVE